MAAELDGRTERIISYLSDLEVPVNAVFFRVFRDGDREYLTRAWFKDPMEVQAKAEEAHARRKGKEPWNGTDFYVSFGQGDHRDWDDARKYGFVSAGGGAWYTKTLNNLVPGNRILVYVPGEGYVGVGIVTDSAVRADQVRIPQDGGRVPLSTLPLRAPDMLHAGDDDVAERVVLVKWLTTVPLDQAFSVPGLFANQNSVCKLRSGFTIEQVLKHFGLDATSGLTEEPTPALARSA